MIGLDEGGRASPHLSVVRAPQGLRDWIELLWIDTARPRRQAPGWRIVPDASAHLIATLGDGPAARVVTKFVGPRSSYCDSDRRSRRLTCGIRFRPGALSRILRVNVRPLADIGVSPEDLTGRPGRALGERVAAVRQPGIVLELLTDFVAVLAAAAEPIDRRVLGFVGLRRTPRVTLPELARAQGVCERTLRTLVSEAVGLTPQRTARVQRLHQALALTLAGRANAASVAAEVGFHDQPHMLREFGDLLGETPRQFCARGRALPVSPIRRRRGSIG